jgi:FkbH-like protein
VAEALDCWPELVRGFAALEPGAVRARCDAVLDHARAVLAALRGRTAAPVLWCGYETPVHPALGVLDAQGPGGQSGAVRGLNAGLRALLAGVPNAFFVDMDLCLARWRAETVLRPPMVGIAPGRLSAARGWPPWPARWCLARALRAGPASASCSTATVCSGAAGRRGRGRRASTSAPGTPARGVMWTSSAPRKSLAARGVVLALCSKNNLECRRVGGSSATTRPWSCARKTSRPGASTGNDKAPNVEALARELNLGLDAMVFVDDSAFVAVCVARAAAEWPCCTARRGRCGQCRRPGRVRPVRHLARSAEDGRAGAMYCGEARRRRLRAEVPDLDAYLRSLNMRLDVRVVVGPDASPDANPDAGEADAAALARVAQLTQKTNQFNLTARRRTGDDVRALAASPGHLVAWVALEDRFGAMGIVGAAIACPDGRGGAELDTFLLSCRALGRGVETALLAVVLAALRARGVARATGLFVPTAKNAQVRDFYPAHGLAPDGAAPQAGALRFVLHLDGPRPAVPGHFSAVDGPAAARGRGRRGA